MNTHSWTIHRNEWTVNIRFCQRIFCALAFSLCAAIQALAQSGLNSESIARSALSVAEATNTTGYCYAAVGRALRPLGVELTGAAAYQAQGLLLKDPRFLPLAVHSIDELRPGDIIVYTRSTSHPYGHIAVYEGNHEEASDHIAPVTHTQAYGSATVFRLRNEPFAQEPLIAAAPDYTSHTREYAEPYNASQEHYAANHESNTIPSAPDYVSRNATRQAPQDYRETQTGNFANVTQGTQDRSLKQVLNQFRRNYAVIAREPIERTLIRRCARFLLR